MKKLVIMLVVLSFVTPVYAITATEKINEDKSVDVTITLSKDEMDLFCVDKATPSEWIRNVVDVNLNHQNSVVSDELYKEKIFNTSDNRLAKIKERKDKRDKDIQEQIDEGGEGVIY